MTDNDTTDTSTTTDDSSIGDDKDPQDVATTASAGSGGGGRRRRRGRRGGRGGRGGRGDRGDQQPDDTPDDAGDSNDGAEQAAGDGPDDSPSESGGRPRRRRSSSRDGSGSGSRNRRGGSRDRSRAGSKPSSRSGSSGSGSSGSGSRSGSSGSSGSDPDSGARSRGRSGTAATEAGIATSDGDSDGQATKDRSPASEAPPIGGTRLAAKRERRGDGRGGRLSGVSEDIRQALRDGPPKTMLVSVDEQRTQVAVLEDRRLVEHHVTHRTDRTLVGNIYMARVQNVLPGMEAAFLDIGAGRNGVLYAGEVLYDDLDIEEGSTPRIEDALREGQKVLVQVTKDAMGTKGPRLTMQLSLAGRYTVLAPNSDVFGISRKLTDRERDRLRKAVKQVKPSGHGVIVRTAAEDVPDEQLAADLERLIRKWERIEERAAVAKALTPVYEEPPLHVKVVRDSFGADYEAAIIDDAEVYDSVVEYLTEVTADEAAKVTLYGPARWEREHPNADADEQRSRFADLFDAYNITEQLRKAMSRKVWLPSGGYLIIEITEAMKVIDVNTGKYIGDKRSSLEEVVLKTNLEAAEEIVRQLRLRDMGGIIIIDFIDMLLKANQEQVVNKLKRELLRDRTKTRVSDVSRLGLVQMTRKNVSHGLIESFGKRCDCCDGTGWTTEFDK